MGKTIYRIWCALISAGLLFCNCNPSTGNEPEPESDWGLFPCDLPEGLDFLRAIWFVKPDEGYIVGKGQHILKYDGDSWEICYTYEITPPYNEVDFKDLMFISGDCGSAVGYEWNETTTVPVVLYYDGSSWTNITVPLDFGSYFEAVWLISKDEIWVAGDDGIAHWNGEVWQIALDEYGYFRDLYFTSPTDGWACCYSSSRILHYDGTGWSLIYWDTMGALLKHIAFSEADHGWAGGDGYEGIPRLLEYKDGEWGETDLAISVDALGFSSPANGWIIEPGDDDLRWNGNGWTNTYIPGSDFRGIYVIDNEDAWAITILKVYHYNP